jgi:hypothetical protein
MGCCRAAADFDVAVQTNARQLNEIMTLLENLNQRLDGTVPPPVPGMSPAPPARPKHDFLSQWSWVERSMVQDIANGEFDIYDLPRLHRDEYLRNRYIAKSVDGVMHPLSGARPHVVQAKTKLQSSLKDPDTFLSAWLIYISIRMAYVPERGPGLAVWTERLVFYSRLQYEFSAIVNYVIAYFRHQNSPPEAWFNADTELHTEHLGNSAQRAVIAYRASSPIKTTGNPKPIGSLSSKPIAEQTCHNWNRPTGCKIKEKTGTECLRRHACGKCGNSAHKLFECSSSAPQA